MIIENFGASAVSPPASTASTYSPNALPADAGEERRSEAPSARSMRRTWKSRIDPAHPGQRTHPAAQAVAIGQTGESLLIVGESGSGKVRCCAPLPGCGMPAAAPSGARHRRMCCSCRSNPTCCSAACAASCCTRTRPCRCRMTTCSPPWSGSTLPNLAHRVGGLDVELDWPKLLSVGEQQRLAFARLLLTKPRFAILDEGNQRPRHPNETSLYQQLLESHTTVISVATVRPSSSSTPRFSNSTAAAPGALNVADRFEH